MAGAEAARAEMPQVETARAETPRAVPSGARASGAPASAAPAPNVTYDLAAFAAGLRPESIPAPVRERVKALLIDSVACALAADRAEEIGQAQALAPLFGAGGTATVIGTGKPLPLGAAALSNGYRITALTACDVYTPAHFHVTPEVVPPALAIAERDRASGSALLVALAAGLETATRVAAGLDYPAARARGWHMPGVAGPLGGAAAVGSLLGFDARRLASALGLAGSQSAGTWAAWGTPAVKFHQSRASLGGLLAGLLAETGFAAAEDVLGAPDGGLLATYAGGGRPERVVEDLGSRWELMRISLRPWPGATPLQPAISALFRLVDAGRLPSPSARVRVQVAPATLEQHAAFRHPAGTFEAMLSVEHAAAAILLRGRLGFAEYGAGAYGDPAIGTAIDRRVEVVADRDLGPLASRVELLEDAGGDGGEAANVIAVAEVAVPRGHPDDPASAALLGDKLRRSAEGVLDDGAATRLLERLESLEAVADVRELTELMRPRVPQRGD